MSIFDNLKDLVKKVDRMTPYGIGGHKLFTDRNGYDPLKAFDYGDDDEKDKDK